ncbi:hypothetical protein ACHAPI_007966 [Fusarium lateritium]
MASLQSLPLETLDQIASNLTPRQLAQVSSTSSRLWQGFARHMFHSIQFVGDRNRVSMMLLNFLSNNNTPRVQEIKRQARSVSFEILYGTTIYEEDDGFLPALIISSINKMPQVFALGLKIHGLSTRERTVLQAQAKSAQRWTAITHLKVDLPNPVFQKLINTSLQGALIQAVDIDTEIRTYHLNMLGAHLPNIRRLRVMMLDPCVELGKFMRQSAIAQGQTSFPDFHHLECLVVADAGSVDREFPSGPDLHANVLKFIGSMTAMNNLRQLAIEFAPEILGWTSARDLGTGTQEREDLNEVLGEIVCDVGNDLPNLLEMCLVECTGSPDLVHKGTRRMVGQVMGATHEVAGPGDTFPRGLLY